MRPVLSVASECAPLVKTGGLADVAGALPAALAGEGWQMRTLLPGYPEVMAALGQPRKVWTGADLFGGPARLLAARAAGLDLLVLDAPHLYDRAGGPYTDAAGADWPDNPQRFAALSWVAALIARDGVGGWKPDLVHAHDWQAGFTPVYLREMRAEAGSILTIHNIAFQGLAPASMLDTLRLPASGFSENGFEFWGRISALKAGLTAADRITTVSPTYASELCEPEFGVGLDGVIRARRDVLCGILNGIDTALWNPATDPGIHSYKTPRGKAKNKAALAAEFGLPEGDGPLAVVISRLTGQKGLDMLIEVLPGFLDRGGRLALLGTGEKPLEAAWRKAGEDPRVSVKIGYDEALSHRMIAGGDAILVPSRFEPCGLTQLYGLRYGTLPVVALTGGLADTVINANDAGLKAGVATGFQFAPVTAGRLWLALEQLCDLWHHDRPAFTLMQRRAMAHPVGWDVSARAYAGLYAQVAKGG